MQDALVSLWYSMVLAQGKGRKDAQQVSMSDLILACCAYSDSEDYDSASFVLVPSAQGRCGRFAAYLNLVELVPMSPSLPRPPFNGLALSPSREPDVEVERNKAIPSEGKCRIFLSHR